MPSAFFDADAFPHDGTDAAPPDARTALMPAWLARAAGGLFVAGAVAFAARRAGSLSTSGALAATVVGAASLAAGWGWGALLLLYFVVSSLLSHAGGAEKSRLTEGIVAKGGTRDATQVLANGGVFALCALATAFADPAWTAVAGVAAVGALAAATADTWATEIGTLFGGTPRAPLTLRPVPPGTSGGMSAAGTAAMIAGALFIALAARALALTDALAVVTLAGCVGAMVDTLLGATLQERRWCDACALATERRIHDCGSPTRRTGGLAAVENDAVNLLATIVGAAVAAALAFSR
jgi:uncharacterized protein (TIGR00297 family)